MELGLRAGDPPPPAGGGVRSRAPSGSGSLASAPVTESVTASLQPSHGAGGAVVAASAKPPGGSAFDLTNLRQARKTKEELKAIGNPQLRAFYEIQNNLIAFYMEVEQRRADEAEAQERTLKKHAQASIEVTVSEDEAPAARSGAPAAAPAAAEAAPAAAEEWASRSAVAAREKVVEGSRRGRLVALAINLSFAANLGLLGIKVYAAATSNSLAVIASTVDSVMDLVSGAVVWAAATLAAKRNDTLFPVGKSRYEPIGIIVFAALMGAASLQLISQGLTSLTEGLGGVPPSTTLDERTYGVLAATIGVKGALFLLCSSVKSFSSSVGALAMDHFNDVINNAGPLAVVLIVQAFPVAWWLDPAVCILMSVYMVAMWAGAAKAQIALITGQAATPRELCELTFLALTHSPSVIAVDTVMAYSLGNKLQVEVDIVLPRDMSLGESHDVGEALQCKIERLDNVERCFVHADYEWKDHKRDQEHYNPYDQPSYAPPED